MKLRSEIEAEVQDKRLQIVKIEERILQKEEEIDAKLTDLMRREQGLGDREVHAKELQEELKQAKGEALDELQRLSGLTVHEAKQQLLERSRISSGTSSRERSGRWRRRRAEMPGGVREHSSQTHSSRWRRVTPPRPP